VGLGGENRTEVKVETRQVALFKNGLAFVVGEARARREPATFDVGPVLAASHATLWAAGDPAMKLEQLAAVEIDTRKQAEAINVIDLLRPRGPKSAAGADGRPDARERSGGGTIRHVAGDRPAPEPSPYEPGTLLRDRSQPYMDRGQLLVLESQGKDLALDTGSVRAGVGGRGVAGA